MCAFKGLINFIFGTYFQVNRNLKYEKDKNRLRLPEIFIRQPITLKIANLGQFITKSIAEPDLDITIFDLN